MTETKNLPTEVLLLRLGTTETLDGTFEVVCSIITDTPSDPNATRLE